jgi:hypothetical protein
MEGTLTLDSDTHESSSFQVFQSFYKEMTSEFSISAKAKNLFLSLAESIAQTPNVTSCYVWGWGGGKHGRPLALGSKGAEPTGDF